MNEGCPAYVKKDTVTPKEAANIIKEASGKVILAHPVAYTYEDDLTIEDTKEILLDMDADGVEAYFIYVDRYDKKHNDINKWLEFAKNNNKFVTIGSDFHTFDNLRPVVGLINEDLNISKETIDEILDNLN